MIRALALTVALVLPAACSRPPAADPPDGAPPPPSSLTPRASASSASGIGFGISASGSSHASVKVQSTDDTSALALRPLFGKLSACYTKSPHHAANGAVRIAMHLAVSATGVVTPSGTAVEGVLRDKGHGEQTWDFPGDASTKDDALLTCVVEAAKVAAFPQASRGKSFDVTIDLSP